MAFVGFILIFTATLSPAATNDLSSALQRGLFEEEANHNLDAAIQAYQAVATQFDKDRKLAATAIFRLGEVYRKQGKTNEAAAQYERILKEFSDQTTLLELSRSNLQATGKDLGRNASSKVSNANQVLPIEEAEIQRIRAMIKDSPDLINAPGQVGLGQTRIPLHMAAQNNWTRVAEFLLTNGADVNRKSDNKTPLHSAVENGHKSMVELLIAHEADLEEKDGFEATALHVAAQKGFKAISEILLKNKAAVNARKNGGDTPLHLTASAGHKAVAELLIASGADINVRNDSDFTPLFSAVFSKNLEMAKFLIDRKAEVNATSKDGFAALHYAIQGGQPQLVQLLLQNGANPDAKIPRHTVRLGSYEVFEFTPLLMAAQAGQTEIAGLLLAAKANPNSPAGTGATPLHYAAGGGFVEIAKALLVNGASVDTQDRQGWTPLWRTLGNSQKSMTELLLSNKADPNMQDKNGETPLGFMKKNSSGPVRAREILVELLLKYGANENAERLARISAGRDSKSSQPLFLKGNSAYNRHSLFEICVESPFMFPDLAKVKIQRLDATTQQTNVISVNMEEALKAGDCSKNIWLEWGDIVEIPELDHPINQSWMGYPKEFVETLQKCLERKVSIAVKGETTNVILRAGIHNFARNQNELNAWRVLPLNWQLNQVVANFLRASSDKTRIKVSRVDPVTKKPEEIIHNLEKTDAANFILLRDGDAIEIPERDPNAPTTQTGFVPSIPSPTRAVGQPALTPVPLPIPANP